MSKKQFAFTLIELLVVIAIIGILSGLIVVSMGGMTDKASLAKAQVFSNSLRNSMMANIISQHTFDDIDSSDYDASTKVINNDVGNIPDSWAGNEGRAYNGPILKESSDCVLGRCISLDGVDDYIDCGNGASSNFGTDSFTVEWWMNLSANPTDQKVIIGNKYQNNYAEKGWLVGDIGGAWIQLGVGTDGGNYFDGGYFPWIYGKWTHYVFVIQRSTTDTTVTGYRNGIRIVSQTKTFTGDINTTASIKISNASYGFDKSSLIDNFRMYNAVMPTSQIKENYYTGLNSLLANGNINAKEYSEKINSIAEK